MRGLRDGQLTDIERAYRLQLIRGAVRFFRQSRGGLQLSGRCRARMFRFTPKARQETAGHRKGLDECQTGALRECPQLLLRNSVRIARKRAPPAEAPADVLQPRHVHPGRSQQLPNAGLNRGALSGAAGGMTLFAALASRRQTVASVTETLERSKP